MGSENAKYIGGMVLLGLIAIGLYVWSFIMVSDNIDSKDDLDKIKQEALFIVDEVINNYGITFLSDDFFFSISKNMNKILTKIDLSLNVNVFYKVVQTFSIIKNIRRA